MSVRSRGYIPHIDSSEGTYFVTFRLADSMPAAKLTQWKNELSHTKPYSTSHLLFRQEYRRRVHTYLDSGVGQCWLSDARVASVMAETLRRFDRQKYHLHLWTIMPNHVHVLFTIKPPSKMNSILHSWKSFTAHQANSILGLSGAFWEREYFDVAIKSERHFEFVMRYIINNPLKAGLCADPLQWRWTGYSEEIQNDIHRFFSFR